MKIVNIIIRMRTTGLDILDNVTNFPHNIENLCGPYSELFIKQKGQIIANVN